MREINKINKAVDGIQKKIDEIEEELEGIEKVSIAARMIAVMSSQYSRH